MMKINGVVVVLLVFLASSSYGGVLRTDSGSNVTSTTTTEKTNTTLEKAVNTDGEDTDKPIFAATRDEGGITILQPVADTPTIAVTRDEGATIVLEPVVNDEDEAVIVVPITAQNGSKILLEASVDPASESLEDDSDEDVEFLVEGKKSEINKKSEALFLFETAKIDSKTKLKDIEQEVEENSGESTTEAMVEITTTAFEDQQELTILTEKPSNSTDDMKPLTNSTKTGAEHLQDSDTVVKDTVRDIPNDKVVRSILVEPEVGYILVEAEPEVEQLATFTHADSEQHLQPIVQSVEIVPVYVDDYYQTW